MKWIKASERLPEVDKSLYLKLFGENKQVGQYYRDTEKFHTVHNIYTINEVEWLDESDQPNSVQEGEKEAVDCEHPFFDVYKNGGVTTCGRCNKEIL